MKPIAKLTYISESLLEIIDNVYATTGSPPFPDIAGLEFIRRELDNYLRKNKNELSKPLSWFFFD